MKLQPLLSELYDLLKATNGGVVSYQLLRYQLWERHGKAPEEVRLPNVVTQLRSVTGCEIRNHIGVGYQLVA